jgi:uncharacterized protein (TIGR00645 family)
MRNQRYWNRISRRNGARPKKRERVLAPRPKRKAEIQEVSPASAQESSARGPVLKRLGIFERPLETLLFSSRWILAPFYLTLVAALLALLLKTMQLAFGFAHDFWAASEASVLLGALRLVELSFAGSLIVLVIFSGYENFVSRLDVARGRNWPEWLTKIDFAGLKLKLMASIVAISAVHLLEAFMDVENRSDRELYWSAGIHGVFVVSTVLLALSQRLWKPEPTERAFDSNCRGPWPRLKGPRDIASDRPASRPCEARNGAAGRKHSRSGRISR